MAAPRQIVIGAGYRDQVTIGTSRQDLIVYPAPVILIGISGKSELIVEPGPSIANRFGGSGLPFTRAAGQLDAGVGFQHLVSDEASTQTAFEVFVTLPTGFPSTSNGFSAGGPTYQASYAVAQALTSRFGVTLSEAAVLSAGYVSPNTRQYYVGFQSSGTLSYATSPMTNLLLEDQLSTPSGPHGPSGNRALFGIQQTISPNVVLDAESEINLQPPAETSQHTLFEAGLTVLL